jgi:hypothetical protein
MHEYNQSIDQQNKASKEICMMFQKKFCPVIVSGTFLCKTPLLARPDYNKRPRFLSGAIWSGRLRGRDSRSRSRTSLVNGDDLSAEPGARRKQTNKQNKTKQTTKQTRQWANNKQINKQTKQTKQTNKQQTNAKQTNRNETNKQTKQTKPKQTKQTK